MGLFSGFIIIVAVLSFSFIKPFKRAPSNSLLAKTPISFSSYVFFVWNLILFVDVSTGVLKLTCFRFLQDKKEKTLYIITICTIFRMVNFLVDLIDLYKFNLI